MQQKRHILRSLLPLLFLLIGSNGLLAQYCIPTYTDSTSLDDYLDGVVLGGINNTGTGGTGQPGYVDYTGTVGAASLTGGASYTISIINGGYVGSLAAWIDYNQDGVFDATEKLGEATGVVAFDTANITFNVPVSVLTTTTVMRVREVYNVTNMDPCLEYSFGQAEDYVVELTGVSYCIPTYVNGTAFDDYLDGVELGTISNVGSGGTGGPDYNDYTNLSTTLVEGNTYTMTVTNGGYDGVIAAWIDFNQDANFDITEKIGETPAAILPNATYNMTFTVPLGALMGTTRMRVREAYDELGMDPCLVYDFGETEDYSVNITSYCTPTYVTGTAFDDYLDGVEFNTISNVGSGATGGPSYNDYTATYSTQVNQNGVYTMTLTNGGYLGLFAAWIDYNQDGTFDLSEQILLTPDTITAFGTYSAPITIPNTSTLGLTRMRVREVYSFSAIALDPCLSYTYGEAEDYTIEILGGAATDLATTKIVSPSFGCTAEDYIVRVRNVGTTAIDMSATPIDVNASVSGAVNTVYPTVSVNTGTLAVNDSLDIIIGTVNTAGPGTYAFSASATVAGDGNLTNDTAVDTVVTGAIYTVNYFEDFDGTTPAAGWVGQGVLLYPAGDHGNNTITLGANLYTFNPSVFGITPKIGAVASTNYFIFDYRMVDYTAPNPATTLQNGDVLEVYASNDCGQTFNLIYVIDSTNHIPTTNMTHVEIPLTAYAGDTVMFAFQGIHGGGTNDFYFDIDSVEVRNLANQVIDDAGVMAFNNPVTSVCENSIVDVVVTIMNYGTSTLSNIQVNADVTGAATANLSTIYTGTLAPGATALVVVGTFNVTTAGMVMIDAYTVLANDADANNDASMVMFNVVANPIVSLGVDTTLCVGQSMTLDAGNAGATYSWSTGATTQTIIVSSPQTVSVTVTNTTGCVGSDDIVLSAPSAIQVMTSNILNVTCNGSNNGEISAMGMGGTNNYTYTWSNNQTGATATGLAAGTYTVTVSDGCANPVTSQPVTITQPSAITATTAATNETCPNSNDGTASVTNIVGGTAPYMVSWSNGGSGNTITGLSPNTYTPMIMDVNGCILMGTPVAVNAAVAIAATTTSTNETCPNAADGTASVNIVGGTAPYSVSWSNTMSGTPIGGLTAGTYTAFITDANGCTSPAAPVTITTTGTIPTAGFTATVAGLGAVNFTSTGTGATSYNWDFGDTGTSTQQNPSHTYATNGSFQVVLFVTNPCGSDTFTQEVVITGVAIENALLANMSAYPNPASDVLNVSFTNADLKDISLVLYDAKGQIVAEKNMGNVAGNVTETLNISSLSKGIYMLAVRSGQNAAYTKIVKQ